MQLDRNAVKTLLALDDAQLRYVITKVAVNMGIDTSYFGLNSGDISAVRKRLSELTDEDLQEAQRQINAKRTQK
jgi:hypothetical protein